MNKIAQLIEDKLAEKVVAQLDLDAMAVDIAKSLQSTVSESAKEDIINHLDLSYVLTEMLNDESTKAGKAYTKALERIATKLADSLGDK